MPKLRIALTMIFSLMTSVSMAHDGRGGLGPGPRGGGNAGGQRSIDFGVHGFGGARGESGSHGFGVIGAPSGPVAPNPNVREWHGGERHFEERHHHYDRSGFVIGTPYVQPNYYWPDYNAPLYYSTPNVIIQSAPPVYIEQQVVPEVPPAQTGGWNYCPDPAGYYPYEQECPGGWLQIEPQPVGQPPGYWYYCSDPPGYYPYVRVCSKAWQNVVP
ncbi:MAG: hypothetical protein ACXWAS_06770 [Methylobacter sp.]